LKRLQNLISDIRLAICGHPAMAMLANAVVPLDTIASKGNVMNWRQIPRQRAENLHILCNRSEVLSNKKVKLIT
jgi:hypothetical protein